MEFLQEFSDLLRDQIQISAGEIAAMLDIRSAIRFFLAGDFSRRAVARYERGMDRLESLGNGDTDLYEIVRRLYEEIMAEVDTDAESDSGYESASA